MRFMRFYTMNLWGRPSNPTLVAPRHGRRKPSPDPLNLLNSGTALLVLWSRCQRRCPGGVSGLGGACERVGTACFVEYRSFSWLRPLGVPLVQRPLNSPETAPKSQHHQCQIIESSSEFAFASSELLEMLPEPEFLCSSGFVPDNSSRLNSHIAEIFSHACLTHACLFPPSFTTRPPGSPGLSPFFSSRFRRFRACWSTRTSWLRR